MSPTCAFLSVDVEKKQVELSFRSGDSSKETSSLKLSDISAAQKVDATVKRIEEYGLFLEIEGSKLRGLCHKSEVTTRLARSRTFLTSC